jgi:UrcA family protein
MIRLTAAIALAAALLAAPTFAAADDVTVRVRTKDLNLQTEAGAKTALERIAKAAKSACSDVVVGSRIALTDEGCVADTTAKLVAQLKAPMVQAAYDAQKRTKVSLG